MGAYGHRMQCWNLMPPIWHDKVERLPRGLSYTRERDAGSVLIALCWPKLKRDCIFVRNVAKLTMAAASGGMKAEAKRAGVEGTPVIVENMREFDRWDQRLRIAEGKKTGSYVQASKRTRRRRFSYLHELLAKGWQIVAGPFMVEEPMHNCALELTRDQWDTLWTTHRTRPWAVRMLTKQTSSKFIDSEETPQAAEIRLHYRSLGVLDGWTPARVRALADSWGMTVRELQHYVCCETVVIDRFMDGRLDVLPGPICLWFFFMERLAAERAGKRFDDVLFPVSLGSRPQAAAA